jgi:hypothetical protein
MSLTLTVDLKASCRGLNSLSPLGRFLLFIIVIALSRSSFSHSLGASLSFVQIASSCHTYLHLKAEACCNGLCYTEKYVS